LNFEIIEEIQIFELNLFFEEESLIEEIYQDFRKNLVKEIEKVKFIILKRIILINKD